MMNNTYNEINQSLYKISETAFKIGEAALTGILYEVAAPLKPGLVTPSSVGAHTDMNYFTFLRSTAAISNAISICAQIGMEQGSEALDKVKVIGIMAERNMFQATNGVNTHKGLLFLAGVCAAAAGACVLEETKLTAYNISNKVRLICDGVVQRELVNINEEKKLTNGELIFKKYGIRGIRGEAEDGFPTIINHGLPSYRQALSSGLSINDSLTQSLLAIICAADDTVVINRSGIDGLNYVKALAKQAISLGGVTTKEGIAFIHSMNDEFISRNISPGGSADLLAVTVMIDELEKIGI